MAGVAGQALVLQDGLMDNLLLDPVGSLQVAGPAKIGRRPEQLIRMAGGVGIMTGEAVTFPGRQMATLLGGRRGNRAVASQTDLPGPLAEQAGVL